MRLSLISIVILGISGAFSISLMDLSTDEKLKIAEDFAKTLNKKIFDARHASFLRESLKGKAAKAWKPDEIMGTDTIAVRIDRNGHVYVAGNIETRTTQFNKQTRQFEGSEFGLNENDHVIIREAMLNHPILRNQPLHIIETDESATNTFDSRAPHGEVKLLWDRENNPPTPTNSNQKRLSVIAASKPACRYCSAQLGTQQVTHNSRLPKEQMQRLGGKLSAVTNWYQPGDIGSVNRATYYPAYHQESESKLITYPGFETSQDLFTGQVAGTPYIPSNGVFDPNVNRITYPGYESTSDLSNGQIAGQSYVSNAGSLHNRGSKVSSTSSGIPDRRHSISGPSTELDQSPYLTGEMPVRVFPASMPVSQQNTEKGRQKAIITFPGDKRWTSSTLGGGPSIPTITAPNFSGINGVNPLTYGIITAPKLPLIQPITGAGLSPKLSILPKG